MRRQARQWSLMVLYGADVEARSLNPLSTAHSEENAQHLVRRFLHAYWNPDPIEPKPIWDIGPEYRVWLPDAHAIGAKDFLRDRVQGVLLNLPDLDQRIQAASQRWRLERMSLIDRNVLRLGAFELVHRADDVPRSVAIHEAVELAKGFGGSESGAFVNGLLEQVVPPSAPGQ